MREHPVITLGSPQPITPPQKRRGGQLQDLLAQSGPQNSAQSATKRRQLFVHQASGRSGSIGTRDGGSKRSSLRAKPTPNYVVTDPSANEDSPVAPTKKTRKSTSSRAEPDSGNSEDELAPSARPRKTSARISAYTEELKMEMRRKNREKNEGLRRSGRERKSTILESDTLPTLSPQRRRAPPPKLDTARTRLRDDIATKTKAKANNFLVANKDLFLPLLPKNNQVAKLVAEGKAQPIVEYRDLGEQPKGVTAVMKPYQLSGLSYLVHLYNNGFSGILGDEMGLGKTLQTLSLFQYLEELDMQSGVKTEVPRPYLVICPLSVLNSWVTEAQKWVPQLKVMRFHGASNERTRLKRVAAGLEDMKGRETSCARNRKASQKAAGRKVSKPPASVKESDAFKIIITTYETFQAEQSWFKHSFVWRYVVLDEGHKIKNSVAQISSALKSISAEYRLILTGTPLQNNLVEMWSLLTWLYPTVFDSKTEALFKESFDLSKGKANKQTMTDARRLLELIMLRRMKDSPSVNLGLPPKEEVLLYVPLTPMQKFWYTRLLTRIDDGMLNELFNDGKEKEKAAIKHDIQENELLSKMEKVDKEIKADVGGDWDETAKIVQEAIAKEQTGLDTNKGAWKKLMNLVMQLRKCCSHPYQLPGVAPEPYYLGDHVIRASGKFILLEKLLKNTIFEQGKKVLIFSSFTRTLDCCEDLLLLIGNHGERFKYLRLDGSTARARRNLDIRLFNQKESDYKVMLLSTRAGGLGINLTTAQDVIFLDEDWNPQITLQAEARAHRIGQTKKVTIYKLCTQGTVEEQMMGRIRKKLYLSAKITESMQNIHGKQIIERKGGHSVDEDMPQMDTSQLMTLVRRGAQTLSHPEIDVKEMISWDLETMIEKCRDQSANMADTATHSEADEDKWLSTMERVECAVFEGKRHQRHLDKGSRGDTSIANILPDITTHNDRRTNKNTTVMVDGFAISKESMRCGDWEAVPTMAGKDPRLAEPVREKRRKYGHEDHCLECFEDADAGHMVECKSCPRVYHYDCLDSHYKSKVKGFSGFYCSQHNCAECGKATNDAGGLIFRCRWCPQGFCEDCLDWDKTELIDENLPEFELLGESAMSGGFYIKCPSCVELAEENEGQRAWMENMEQGFKEQHDVWLQQQNKTQRELNDGRGMASLEHEIDSPPALTDKSLSTPVLGGSRVSTPKDIEQAPHSGKRAGKRNQPFNYVPSAKKSKLSV